MSKQLSDGYDPTADPADVDYAELRDLYGNDPDPDEYHEAHVPQPSLSVAERNGNFTGWPFRP